MAIDNSIDIKSGTIKWRSSTDFEHHTVLWYTLRRIIRIDKMVRPAVNSADCRLLTRYVTPAVARATLTLPLAFNMGKKSQHSSKRARPNVGSALRKPADGPDFAKGVQYWDGIEASVDGVLGGFGHGVSSFSPV